MNIEIVGQENIGIIIAYIAIISPNSPIDPMITRFSSGKFIYNMSGLPGVALAMYSVVKVENKR